MSLFGFCTLGFMIIQPYWVSINASSSSPFCINAQSHGVCMCTYIYIYLFIYLIFYFVYHIFVFQPQGVSTTRRSLNTWVWWVKLLLMGRRCSRPWTRTRADSLKKRSWSKALFKPRLFMDCIISICSWIVACCSLIVSPDASSRTSARRPESSQRPRPSLSWQLGTVMETAKLAWKVNPNQLLGLAE